MLTIEWDATHGWRAPLIRPFGNLSLHPGCSSLHYSIQLFEGLKAYRGDDGQVRLFRPMLNMERMIYSAKKTCLPAFEPSELLECIRKLVEVDQDWLPQSNSITLYIRPTYISTEPTLALTKPTRALLYVILSKVRSYAMMGLEDMCLWANTKYERTTKGGTGDCKMGCNYSWTLYALNEAKDYGCNEVLWLHGDNHQITEVGKMNIFLHWINEDGEEELATPPLDGMILPGVTRQSILDLTRQWGEFKVTERCLNMHQLCSALEQKRVKQMFGCGTACTVSPVGSIYYQGEHWYFPSQEKSSQLTTRITKELRDIQYGRTPSDWTYLV
uniref:branched-chain-amino-acid aminotransferase, cytosolic n=1 Tax=Doryrhamphus excisus TaxID=161450 RepID=UPI0025AE7056|nr:branched-chain-amino-acid aminotransferase, cytosolic [Doryrhamphus excisus]